MGKSEATIQSQFIARVNYLAMTWSPFVFAIPNGGKRDPKTAALMKQMGVKPGAPDVFCAIPKLQWHGLFIEFKKPGGSLSQAQKELIPELEKMRYLVKIFDNVDDAFNYFEEYVNYD